MSPRRRQQMDAAQPAALIPIRVDACTEDGHVRIIDTLLFDPNCWPIPLLPPLHEAVEQNVQELAHTIISDSEVLGMGRTVRHFTNRVDLWSPQLQELVEHQLRVQLWAVVESHHRMDDDGMRPRRQSPSGTQRSSPTITHISLRLTVNNISISDDFDWDTSVPNMCPIDFAITMARELNLPSEAAVAIATSIVEQLHGVPMSQEKNLVPSSTGETTSATTAVLLESRDHIANVAHAVAMHRPAILDQRIN
jgi:hypothetical protein